MKKLWIWGTVTLIVFLVSAAVWWFLSGEQDHELSKYEAFVYSYEGKLYWLELNSRIGKVSGKLYQQELLEEIGEEPVIIEKENSLTGRTSKEGYEFQVNINGEIVSIQAMLSEKGLSVLKQGDSQPLTYLAADKEELDSYKRVLQEELETALYYAEEKEKNRIRTFFEDLKNVFGYFYSNDNGRLQLLVKIDEAYPHGGEITGSLLLMENTGDPNKRYEETEYKFNGITDGQVIRIYVNKDGEEKKLEGNFIAAATGFHMSFWTAEQKLKFDAVTEEEFTQSFNEFKANTQE